MHFLVIGHVVHKFQSGTFFAYGPYVREMNLWFTYANQVTILAPLNSRKELDMIDLPYNHPNLKLKEVPEFNLRGLGNILKTLVKLPGIIRTTSRAIAEADHIHLRCPGNMGLIGAMVQVFYPHKTKTAKYAGNWDRQSSQPFTYRLQQTILSNPKWSKNMKVLVYGDWPNESKNIYPFFTASYSETEIWPVSRRILGPDKLVRLIFVGGLNSGKQPLVSAFALKSLLNQGIDARLDFFGEGPDRTILEEFVHNHNLEDRIYIHGNVSSDTVKLYYQHAHFLLFISKSEGWPKVVAESMFWGCLPITTAVSCVPQMVDYGQRGDLVSDDPAEISKRVISYLQNPEEYYNKVEAAAIWSRQFTLERFERELKSLIAK